EKAWRKWEQAGASFEAFWTSSKIPKGVDLWPYEQAWFENAHDRSRSMMALAANPYMLYMITQVFTQAGVLPTNRGLLFQEFITYLLETREHLTQHQATILKARLADLAYN